jgi:hypothetical protein
MVKRIEISLLILDDNYREADIREMIDKVFNDKEVGWWTVRESKEIEISEEEAEEITGY